MVYDRAQVVGPEDLQVPDSGCLSRVRPWQNQRTVTPFLAAGGDRERSAHGPQTSTQAELPNQTETVYSILRDDAHSDEKAHSDGQIEGASLLGHIRRSEIHRDATGRKGVPHIVERGGNALPSLTDRTLWEPDDDERGQPHGQIHFDGDRVTLDPLYGSRADVCEDRGSPGLGDCP